MKKYKCKAIRNNDKPDSQHFLSPSCGDQMFQIVDLIKHGTENWKLIWVCHGQFKLFNCDQIHMTEKLLTWQLPSPLTLRSTKSYTFNLSLKRQWTVITINTQNSMSKNNYTLGEKAPSSRLEMVKEIHTLKW